MATLSIPAARGRAPPLACGGEIAHQRYGMDHWKLLGHDLNLPPILELTLMRFMYLSFCFSRTVASTSFRIRANIFSLVFGSSLGKSGLRGHAAGWSPYTSCSF